LTAVAGAALACAWISLPQLAFAPMAAGIALAWAWHLTRALHWRRSAIRTLELSATGAVRCQDGLGQWRDGEILAGSYVSRWLIVAVLGSGDGRRHSLVLLPDCAAAEELRRLRVWLRWRLTRG
jgi:hypothetical protein